METLRILWPYIVGLICTGIVIGIIYWFLMKYVPDDTIGDGTYTARQIIRKIFFWLTVAILTGFLIYGIRIISTNTIPRSELDKSSVRQAEDNFERNARENAATRHTTDTIKTTKP